MSLRGAKRRGNLLNNPGIATPVCTLVRNDSCILFLLLLAHPEQVLVVSAVAVNDGAVGLEGNDTVTDRGQHFMVVGCQKTI